MSDAVVVKKIEKAFKSTAGKNFVLKNISFSLKAGELLIVTGKNGAGKTTLLRILAGLLLPDSGKVAFLGKDALKHTKEIREIIGFMSSEERNLYWKLTGRQNLEFFAALYGIDNKTVADRLERLTELLELKEFLDKPVEDCSLGMKQRLSIARCLLPHPQVILFDEPLKGLDKGSKKIFLELLGVLHEKRYSVILTTHTIEDFKTIKHRRLELSK